MPLRRCQQIEIALLRPVLAQQKCYNIFRRADLPNEMTGFLLIRHTSHDLISTTIAGRMPGVHLNKAGQTEAQQLASDLVSLPIKRIVSGPLERVRETAEPLAEKLQLPMHIAPEFDEVETGEWTGLTFAQLAPRTDWQNWNRLRSCYRPPGGEFMLDVQARV